MINVDKKKMAVLEKEFGGLLNVGQKHIKEWPEEAKVMLLTYWGKKHREQFSALWKKMFPDLPFDCKTLARYYQKFTEEAANAK